MDLATLKYGALISKRTCQGWCTQADIQYTKRQSEKQMHYDKAKSRRWAYIPEPTIQQGVSHYYHFQLVTQQT